MNIAITIHYGKAPLNIITGHPSSRTTSYFMDKNISTEHWYTIESIDVIAGKRGRAIAVIGNSITDGRGSTTNGQNRWPDVLSERLLKNKATRDVIISISKYMEVDDTEKIEKTSFYKLESYISKDKETVLELTK